MDVPGLSSSRLSVERPVANWENSVSEIVGVIQGEPRGCPLKLHPALSFPHGQDLSSSVLRSGVPAEPFWAQRTDEGQPSSTPLGERKHRGHSSRGSPVLWGPRSIIKA